MVAVKKKVKLQFDDFGKVDELTWKLKEAKHTIKELKQDLMSHKKIQADQSRAI